MTRLSNVWNRIHFDILHLTPNLAGSLTRNTGNQSFRQENQTDYQEKRNNNKTEEDKEEEMQIK